MSELPVVIAPDAVPALIDYLQSHQHRPTSTWWLTTTPGACLASERPARWRTRPSMSTRFCWRARKSRLTSRRSSRCCGLPVGAATVPGGRLRHHHRRRALCQPPHRQRLHLTADRAVCGRLHLHGVFVNSARAETERFQPGAGGGLRRSGHAVRVAAADDCGRLRRRRGQVHVGGRLEAEPRCCGTGRTASRWRGEWKRPATAAWRRWSRSARPSLRASAT